MERLFTQPPPPSQSFALLVFYGYSWAVKHECPLSTVSIQHRSEQVGSSLATH